MGGKFKFLAQDNDLVFNRELRFACGSRNSFVVVSHFVCHSLKFQSISSCFDTFKNCIKSHQSFQNFKTSLNMFVESYQITSEFFRNLKQVLTCFQNLIISPQKFYNVSSCCNSKISKQVLTCLKNSIKSHQSFQNFKTSLNISKESLGLIEVLGALLALKLNDPLSIKSVKNWIFF